MRRQKNEHRSGYNLRGRQSANGSKRLSSSSASSRGARRGEESGGTDAGSDLFHRPSPIDNLVKTRWEKKPACVVLTAVLAFAASSATFMWLTRWVTFWVIEWVTVERLDAWGIPPSAVRTAAMVLFSLLWLTYGKIWWGVLFGHSRKEVADSAEHADGDIGDISSSSSSSSSDDDDDDDVEVE